MPCIFGFTEQFGIDAVKRDYVIRKLCDFARLFGYSQIQIPILERASSFSENVIGKTPWPEWNPNGCFFLDIQNFNNSYDSSSVESVLLIPEGTVSVTRWLGDQLSGGIVQFPLKVFYNITCYRNEIIETLSDNKRREFSQFGLEILGSQSIHADTEIFWMACQCLEKLGISKDKIRIRLNNVAIFNDLITESGLREYRVCIKELLDTLAEIKAGKGIHRFDSIYTQINEILNNAGLSKNILKKWNALIEQKNYSLDNVISVLGNKYSRHINMLTEVCCSFQKRGVTIATDLCVIRSHEYYTGLSFEVDVVFDDIQYIEIAGGGRYDRLVSSFISEDIPIKEVPCTGFAFGVERVIKMMDDRLAFNASLMLSSSFHFNKSIPVVKPQNNTIDAYFSAFDEAAKYTDGASVDIKRT